MPFKQYPKMESVEIPLNSSFRDPSGYVFRIGGEFYRRISPSFQGEYKRLMESGLYQVLTEAGLLISHEEEEPGVLHPEQLGFISYPYEWSFCAWKEAALTTLAIQEHALTHGMTLKDASAFNIQFRHGKPVLIDTLSFETYQEGEAWVAYRQFCTHFLAPLSLMAHRDIRLGEVMRVHLDGIPLDFATNLLPWQCRFNPLLFAHLYVQAHLQQRGNTNGAGTDKVGAVSLSGLRALLDSLRSAIKGLSWEPKGTVWADYYTETNYTPVATQAKIAIVESFLDRIGPIQSLWDYGANDARFSRLASARGISTIAFDSDPAAVEKAFREMRQEEDSYLLPLRLNLTNPSPDLGWAQSERMSLLTRGPADAILALALVHHLVIAANVPLNRVADFFAESAQTWLIVEFVPKEDTQTQRLLRSRRDIFDDYTQEGFEAAFAQRWRVVRSERIPESVRTLYLMEKIA